MGPPLFSSCASSVGRQRVPIMTITLHCEQLATMFEYTSTVQAGIVSVR